jgi:hypothetical protein
MIKSSLREFIDRVADKKAIGEDDVKFLCQTVLEDGLISRQDAETLLALDRSHETGPDWDDALVALMVDYVVWGTRPTGRVAAEDARWLAAALELGGPTETAMRIAYAVIEEAHDIDESLIQFIMRGRQQSQRILAA